MTTEQTAQQLELAAQIRHTHRPLTFTHAGKTWTYHRPGDPMPCDGEKIVILLRENREEYATPVHASQGKLWIWADPTIIGWRYADEKKTATLNPEDVPPGSEFRFNSSLPGVSWTRLGVNANGVILYTPGQELNCKKNIQRTISWNEMSDMQINRSLSKGQWNPDAWEPCHKTI